jgi:cytochrome c
MRGLIVFVLLMVSQFQLAKAANLHDAAKKGDPAAIAAGLDAGADVNKVISGATPLYFAAIRGHLEAAKLLIARGADVNIKTNSGTALMAASARGAADLVIVLLASGADPNAELKTETALHIAAERGCLDCVMALVKAGANVNAQLVSGNGPVTTVRTPLHLATRNGHNDVAAYLKSNGVILAAPAPISQKLASADIGRGNQLFEEKCVACHSPTGERITADGPLLRDIVGRDKASEPNFKIYSKTLLAAEGAWTYEELNLFLSGPTATTTPGLKMEVQGVPEEADRVNLIAYLRTLSNNPVPLP